MSSFERIVAAHPLRRMKPYNAIKFASVNKDGTPLYTVGRDPKTMGPAKALRCAFEQFGAHCFHCKKWMPPEPLSHERTRDHLRSKQAGGRNLLHNLVFACGPCNRAKGAADLISFSPELGSEYLEALQLHLDKCLESLKGK